MCLYVGNIEGFISNNDVICYKRIVKKSDGNYYTPCQNWKVELDKLLVPDEPTPHIEKLGFKHKIDGGVIHAYVTPPADSDTILLKAIIPKGTRFWVQDDLRELAAEKLYLSAEEVKVEDAKFDYASLLDIAADVYTKDGRRKKPGSSGISVEDVVGFFAYDDQVMAKEVNLEGMRFSEKVLGDVHGHTFTDWQSATSDMDGEKNTKWLEETQAAAKLGAVEFCRAAGGYLPSAGQLKRALTNLLSINLTRVYFGLEPIPVDRWYWSSSLRSNETVYVCFGYGRGGWGGYDYWDNWNYRVVCFLSSH